MNDQTVDEKKNRLSFWNFLATLKWLFLFNFKLAPWAATAQVVVRILIDTSPLFNAYIFARLIDKIIKIAASSNSNLNEIIPLLGFLLAYNLILAALNWDFSS